MNKTKIICSIGPSSSDTKTIEKMINAGMDVARFNMSHGTHESHKKLIENVKIARNMSHSAVAIMIDTKGPEIRIKQFEKGKINLSNGDKFTLTTKDVVGNIDKVSVTYKKLPKILKKGAKILLNDGNIELKAIKITSTDVICEVVHGGLLSNNKSINLPGIKTDMPYLSETDKQDLFFAKEMDADYIAISFVSTDEDVKDVRNYLKEIDFKDVKIISKIENQEGVENFAKILNVSDGIMVARGDLGVEVDFEKIPILQKEFIKKCNNAGKISVTATQMLETMITSPRPTRAEISDVANSIFDGTTATMLSGETASGIDPENVVKTMQRIANEAEIYAKSNANSFETHNISKSLGYAVYALSTTKNVKAIVVVTKSGETAENISRFRPDVPIIACTPSEKTYNRMSFLYGVLPVLDKTYTNMDDLVESSIANALATGLVSKDDKVVLVRGKKVGKSGSNLMEIRKL